MFIQTESTPNPATLKFLPGEVVMQAGTADFPNREAADTSALARRVFAVTGVTGVFLGPDFVTVTKEESKDNTKGSTTTRGSARGRYRLA